MLCVLITMTSSRRFYLVYTAYHYHYKKRKSHLIIPNLQLWDFSKGLKNKFETAVVNEPSVFEPLKFYCIDQVGAKLIMR